MARDEVRRDFWKGVLQELSHIAPRPGAGELDIYRTARSLIVLHGPSEAARVAWQHAIGLEGDLIGQTTWSRVTDAINALARRS